MPKTEKRTLALVGAQQLSNGVMARVHELQAGGDLTIPADYSPENAINAAYLKLQDVKDKAGRPAADVCTSQSAANALLDMVVQGLSPAKNQCYFIVYGDQLTLQRSYQGTIAVAKRFGGVKDVFAQVVYKGDGFEFEVDPETGIRRVTRHAQSLEAINGGEILAAYATVIREDGPTYQEIMTWSEIRAAWGQGATKGSSPAHKTFAQEMAKKTVINRALKTFINSSSDAPVLADAYNRTTANNYQRDEAREIIDVEEQELKDNAIAALFGGPPEDPAADPEDTSGLTDEEKAAIIEAEIAEAAAEEAALEIEGVE